MSIHERTEALADLYAVRALPEVERRELEEHAASCATCGHKLRDAGEFARWLSGTIAPDAPPANLEERLVGKLWQSDRPGTHVNWTPVKRVLKVLGSLAAVFLLIVVGAAFTEGIGSTRTGLEIIDSDAPDERGPIHKLAKSFRRSRGEPATGFHLSESGLRETLALNAPTPSPESPAPRKPGLHPAATPPPPPAPAREEPTLGRRGGAFGGRMAEAEKKADEAGEFLRKAPGADAGKAGNPAGPAPLHPLQENRKIIRNGDLQLEVDSYEATYAKVSEIVAAEKGFVAGADTQKLPNGKMRATVTVRIPPERFEAALARFRELGTVRHQNITTQDVTKQYVDLEARRTSKEALVERLKKVLAEAKGTVKELMEVEVQMGKTLEEIEAIKGELKYYDNLVGLSTIILRISEKDLGLPFEYVETLQSAIGLTVREVEPVYAQAQKAITDAAGQVVDSRMTRQSDGSAQGTIRGRVDAEKFPAVREALRKLGHVTNDTVNQQRTGRGGSSGAPNAPLKKEQAVIDLTVSTAQIHVARTAQLVIETGKVEEAYVAARRMVEEAGGKITTGSLNDTLGQAQGTLTAQVDADKFVSLVERLKAAGKVRNATTQHFLPSDPAVPVREKADINLTLVSPPDLIPEDQGLMRTLRDTFSGSIAGLLWSVEKLFVGISLAGPWIAAVLVVVFVWRRLRRKKPKTSTEA